MFRQEELYHIMVEIRFYVSEIQIFQEEMSAYKFVFLTAT